jgi:hypothetical protein
MMCRENRKESHKPARRSGNDDQSEPRPCNRYAKRLPLNAKFIAHMPSCDACKAVVAYLKKESEINLYSYRNRN